MGQGVGKAVSSLILFGHLLTLLENRRVYIRSQHVGVLKTASGFQGEKPLVHRRMWVKEFGKIDS